VDPSRKEAINGKWMKALKCGNPKCPEPVPVSAKSCPVCSTPLPTSTLDFLKKSVSKSGGIPENYRFDWIYVEMYLKMASAAYHPKSLALAKIYSHAADLAALDPKTEDNVADYVVHILAGLRHVFGDQSMEVLKESLSLMMTLKRASSIDPGFLKDIMDYLNSFRGGGEEFWMEFEDLKILMELYKVSEQRLTNPNYRKGEELEFLNVTFA
jgi:hypothetical protein